MSITPSGLRPAAPWNPLPPPPPAAPGQWSRPSSFPTSVIGRPAGSMEPPPAVNFQAAHSANGLWSGSTSYHDPDVVEVSSSSASWVSNQPKRKRSQAVPRDVIEIDEDDDSAVLIIGESTSNNKHKQVLVDDEDWPKNVKGFLVDDPFGYTKYHGPETDKSMETLKSTFAEYNYDYADFYDYFGYDSDVSDNGCNYNLTAKFDDLDLPLGMEDTVSHLQKLPSENPTKNEKVVVQDEIDIKYKAFKKFDIVQDFSDHHFFKPDNVKATSVAKKPSKNWTKRIQHEWKILEEDLPATIFVRVYEERMDLLRAVIVGPAGTPYHDGLFFFDCFFPSTFPSTPPLVHYHSGGLRLNPNLYACGKVCLSLLGTWRGHGCEKWCPGESTMLQILVSIQALVLNAKPYFNEPGFEATANTAHGEMQSLAYNEGTFVLSCKTMLYSLRKPPKNFEDFVAGHFRTHGHSILVACRAYMDGAQVGCVDGDGVQDVDEGDKSSSSSFKIQLKGLFEDLLTEFTFRGADCAEFLAQKVNADLGKAAALAAQTTLRLF